MLSLILFLLMFKVSSVLMMFWFLLVQARFFFQQLISGVSYCHAMVCSKKCFVDLLGTSVLVIFVVVYALYI